MPPSGNVSHTRPRVISSHESQVFHGVLPPAQLLLVPDRIRDAPVTVPVESNRIRDAPPPDAGEALWLTYYRHIFNPARLKMGMMKKEMPTRYWHNLPEAALITELAQTAHERSAQMVAAGPTTPRKAIAPLRPDRSRDRG